MEKIKKIKSMLADKRVPDRELTCRLIKFLLIRNNITQAEIGRELSLSRSNVNRVIMGRRGTYRIRMAIAHACGASVEDLWPQEKKKGAA